MFSCRVILALAVVVGLLFPSIADADPVLRSPEDPIVDPMFIDATQVFQVGQTFRIDTIWDNLWPTPVEVTWAWTLFEFDADNPSDTFPSGPLTFTLPANARNFELPFFMTLSAAQLNAADESEDQLFFTARVSSTFEFAHVPEIDPGSLASGLTLLVGGILVLTGRRRLRSA